MTRETPALWELATENPDPLLADPWRQFAPAGAVQDDLVTEDVTARPNHEAQPIKCAAGPSPTWTAWALHRSLNALADAILDALDEWPGPHAGPMCREFGNFGVCSHDSCRCIAMDHACTRDAFLDDPITCAYGVGSEMAALIECATCDALGWGTER